MKMIGGFPEGVFQLGFRDDRLVAASGRAFDVSVQRTSLHFTDSQDQPRHFGAYTRTLREADGAPLFTLMLSVNNKLPNGSRHPDIYPAKLLERTVRFFEQVNGKRFACIADLWLPGSDNLRMYLASIKGAGRNPDLERRAAAAQATWTGQQAQKLGFTLVSEVLETPIGVGAHFRRPNA